MIRQETELNQRWTALWQRAGGVGDSDIPFAVLMSKYTEPSRHHHTCDHINDGLVNLDKVRHMARNPDAVEMAFWTHDVEYNPLASDNESRSAEFARQIFTEAQFPSVLVDEACALVRLTKEHHTSDDVDEQIMSDLDLLILGSHPKRYGQYKDDIRQEYIEAPMYRFRMGRVGFLEIVKERLKEGKLFQLPYFRFGFEENALYNVTQEIDALRAMRVAVYAGSFDPPTNGHLHLIDRASRLFDNLIVAIGQNPSKKGGRFPLEDRLTMLREITSPLPNVDITDYPAQYLIDYTKSVGAGYIVRGLRNERDYAEEAALDEFNFGKNPGITTYFLRTPDKLSRISSSFVMGLVGYNDNWEEEVRARVPEQVFKRIMASWRS